MDYVLQYIEEMDDWGSYAEYQETLDDLCKFSACDLTQCPEDATLYRGIFNINDYAATLNLGIELGKQGYDRVVLKKVDNLNNL